MSFITSPSTKRWMQILTIIEREQVFKVGILSERLAISQRTLVKDLRLIKEHFGECIELVSGNSGFHFEERNRVLFKEKKEQLLNQEVLFEIIGNIFYGEVVDLNELAYRYNYAETTLRRFIARVQPALKEYGLSLSFTPVTLVGDEASIRKFFFDFYYVGESTPYTIRPPEGLHHVILKGLSDKLGKYEVGTGLTISAFYSLLYITIVRAQKEHYVSIPEWAKELVYQENDFKLLEILKEVIFKEYGVSLPKEELAWLHYMIICTRTINQYDREKTFLARFNFWTEVKPIVKAYFAGAEFKGWDQSLLEDYLTSFLVSRKLNEVICPSLNKRQAEEVASIKTYHRESYYKNKAFLEKYKEELAFATEFMEDIAISFTTVSDLLRDYYQPKKNILFLIEGDSMVVQMIRLQAIRLFSNKYQVIFLSLHELTEERLKADQKVLIVTNYRPYILDYGLTDDYILLSSIPTKKDWERVICRLYPQTKECPL